MNRYAFRIHYDGDSRRIGHIPMDGDGVHAALCSFRDRLPAYLREMGAQAEVPEAPARSVTALRVCVHTHLDWERATVAMGCYAERHGLRAIHVTSALVAAPHGALPARRPLGALLEARAGALARRRFSLA
jgi:hypothetical protein